MKYYSAKNLHDENTNTIRDGRRNGSGLNGLVSVGDCRLTQLVSYLNM